MNNERFKEFIAPIVDHVIGFLGGVDEVREMHTMVSMTPFVSGWVCGTILCMPDFTKQFVKWRGLTGPHKLGFTLEEIRRIHDFVRLRLESESTTS